MASSSPLAPPDRWVIDELPPRIGLLPGEVDLLCEYLWNVLDAVTSGSNIHGRKPENDDES